MRLRWWIGVVVGATLVCLLSGTTSQSVAAKSKVIKTSPRVEKREEQPVKVRGKRETERSAALPKIVPVVPHRAKTQPQVQSRPQARPRALLQSRARPQPQIQPRALVSPRISVQPRLARRTFPREPQHPASIVREIIQLPEPAEPGKDFQSMLLADAETGQLLLAENIDKRWPTASLAKMMVGLLAMEDIEEGRVSLQTPVVISTRASRERGRTINIRPGEVFPLGELLQAMLVTSANDATVAVAERLRGSVAACVAAMNSKARALGMRSTRYQTVNGLPLPGGSAGDISSARDLAVLGMELIRYRRVLHWTSLYQVPFRDGMAMLPNTNHLVGRVDGVTGLKTGFTVRARYNLVATAQRGEKNLIVVVLGGRNSRVRFDAAEEFLEWGFSKETYRSDTDESREQNENSYVSPASYTP